MRTHRSVAPRRARPVLGQPAYVAPRYHSSLWGRAVFLALILLLCGGVGVVSFGIWSLYHSQSGNAARVAVRVGSGDTVTTLADRLHRDGVVDNPLLFRLDARLHSLSSKLKVGVYTLRRNMSIDQMVVALTVYHSPTIAITIPEGYRSEQIASVLQAHGISGSSFLAEVRRPQIHSGILSDKPPAAGLEGYLFPSTYLVSPTSTGREVADLMVETLNKEFSPGLRAQARAHGFSVFQALTLASIVERETPDPAERPVVAGVYANRLRLHMFMDADPTIQYSLGSKIVWTRQSSASPHLWWPVLTSQQEYQLPLQYNTYIHYGLPPGPIANAGLASIQAACAPKRTPYLYFVARGNGHHIFARTYAEQLANTQKYASH